MQDNMNEILDSCGRIEYILHSLEKLLSDAEFKDNKHYSGKHACDFLLDGLEREKDKILGILGEIQVGEWVAAQDNP